MVGQFHWISLGKYLIQCADGYDCIFLIHNYALFGTLCDTQSERHL